MEILRGEHLTKKYGRGDAQKIALSDVSFTLMQGDILGIVGESGSGKSTLLKLISGIEKPESGDLYFQNANYTGQSIQDNGKFLQMIFQDAYGSFDPRMSMDAALKESGNYARGEIVTAIQKVGLSEDLLDRHAKHLSGGQCQRMAICRALLQKVPILLCDEVTSALDVSTQKTVVELLSELNQTEGLSIIFVSHDIALVSNLCHRMLVMKDGQCVERGTVRDVISSPQDAYTRKLLSSVMDIG